jgi:hypothetical protein
MDHSNRTLVPIQTFAEEIYQMAVNSKERQEMAKRILTAGDEVALPNHPQLTSGNLRSLLIGGTVQGSISLDDLFITRLCYEPNQSAIATLLPSSIPQSSGLTMNEFKTHLYKSVLVLLGTVFPQEDFTRYFGKKPIQKRGTLLPIWH